MVMFAITIRKKAINEKDIPSIQAIVNDHCVDTVGLDTEMIRKYVKYQETKERDSETPKYE
jgi:hypothetical protein